MDKVGNISEEMEEILEIEEVKDSGLTQLKYLFSSWTKYFNSINIYPRFLIFLIVILVFTMGKLPFRNAERDITIEQTRVILEDQFENNTIYQNMEQKDLDAIIEMSLEATKNMYSVPIYMLTSIIGLVFLIFVTTVFYFVLAKILRSKVTFKKMFSAGLGYGVLMSINLLIFSLSVSLTGSLTSVASFGIFFMEAPLGGLTYTVSNAIDIFTIITAIFCYFMGINLLELNKKKSIIFTILAIVLPIILIILQTLVAMSISM